MALETAGGIEIRRFEKEDRFDVSVPILRFHSEFVDALNLPVRAESAQKLIGYFCGELPGAVAFIARDRGRVIGFIAGLLGPWMMDQSVKVFEEIAWYVLPEWRKGSAGLKLYRAAERFTVENGGSFMLMGSEAIGNPAIRSFYERKGYRELETKWIKRV